MAILENEPDAPSFESAIASAANVRISAGTYVELAIVIDRIRDPLVSRRLDDLMRDAAIAIEPVTEEHARIARLAHQRFGRGSGHPARLNFGDCFAYALARAADEPLLFKGDDFIHTDVASALS